MWRKPRLCQRLVKNGGEYVGHLSLAAHHAVAGADGLRTKERLICQHSVHNELHGVLVHIAGAASLLLIQNVSGHALGPLPALWGDSYAVKVRKEPGVYHGIGQGVCLSGQSG